MRATRCARRKAPRLRSPDSMRATRCARRKAPRLRSPDSMRATRCARRKAPRLRSPLNCPGGYHPCASGPGRRGERPLGVAGHRTRGRGHDRRPGRDDAGPLDSASARGGPAHRRRHRNQRQVHHHPDDRGRAGHAGPGGHQRRGRQYGRRPGRRAGRSPRRGAGRPGSRRDACAARLGRGRRRRPRPAQPVARPAGPGRRDQRHRTHAAGRPGRAPPDGGGRQLRRRADDLGRLRQPERGVGGRGRCVGE